MTLDPKSMKALIERFEKAPARMQSNAMRSVGRAGATVVKNYAKAGAPSHLKGSVKVVPRKANGKKLITKFSVAVGGGERIVDIKSEVAGFSTFNGESLKGMKFSQQYPAMWVEFGTYGKRDYKGEEPYSPETLKKKNYASGRSDSPMWGMDWTWIEAKPFMRPAINDHVQEVVDAMVVKLDTYLAKKGL